MKKIFKNFVLCVVITALFVNLTFFAASSNTMPINAPSAPEIKENCTSAILMEADTGSVLYEHNADAPLPPASVTKVMTLLLVMEAIDDGKINYNDMVSASAHACSMGGSQIYLKEGELMSVEDLLKSVVIASANDAAVALAEYVAGSEDAFVALMNEKAKELGMLNTNFENTNGLDDTAKAHYTSARDIAIMSRELIKHKKILEYSSIWMDTIRDGAFGLTNTNRLVRFYKGANGLKTGSTSKAGFCITATAERDGMTLICVIMNAQSRDIRNSSATKLLDYGFSNYCVYRSEGNIIENISICGSSIRKINGKYSDFSLITEKSQKNSISSEIVLNENISAPINKGDKIGEIIYSTNGKEIGRIEILSENTAEKITFSQVFFKIISGMSLK